MKKEDGITIIPLMIIVIVIAIVIVMGLQYAKQYIEEQKLEDTKATMLAIQGIITNIKNKHIVDEENNSLEGVKLDIENNETEYQIEDELKNILLNVENPEFYILNQEDLNNHGIKDIEINEKEFYIVEYNSEEVYYSLGVNGKYNISNM